MNNFTEQIAIVDTDALIALTDETDILANQALQTAQLLAKLQFTLIFPATTIVETATTLQRKLQKTNLVHKIIAQSKKHDFLIEPTTQQIIDYALEIFNPVGSKKNTFFDAIVAATAKKLNTPYIFSFDDWYRKKGYTLITGKTLDHPKNE